jgi:hypothetical protein
VTIDYEAAAKSRWDARFGEGSWDNPESGPATDEQVEHTHAAFLVSARRDVDAALKNAGFTKTFASGESPTE